MHLTPPNWWPEPVPKGHALKLIMGMSRTRQAARQWHERISGWMEEHEYHAVNSEKTMFMKWDGPDYIMYGLSWMTGFIHQHPKKCSIISSNYTSNRSNTLAAI